MAISLSMNEAKTKINAYEPLRITDDTQYYEKVIAWISDPPPDMQETITKPRRVTRLLD
jgi:hypothetical protein